MTSNQKRTGKQQAGGNNRALPDAIKLGLFSGERKVAQISHDLQCPPLKALQCPPLKEPPQDASRRTMTPKKQAADRRIPAAVPAMQQQPPEMPDLPPSQDPWGQWTTWDTLAGPGQPLVSMKFHRGRMRSIL